MSRLPKNLTGCSARRDARAICQFVLSRGLLLSIAVTAFVDLALGGQTHAVASPNTLAQTEWCHTDVRWRSRSSGGYLRGGGCPTEGSCDSASIRDSWIPDGSVPPVSIRVLFNVFRESDGSGSAATQEDVDAQLAQMNADFEPSRIQFVGTARFIDDSTYRHFTDPEEAGMKNTYSDQPDRQVNVFVTDIQAGYVGVGTFPWDPDALENLGGIVIDENYFGAGQSVMTHEMGHNLGLWHTHHGVSEVESCSECYELAGGSNGDATGDFCADTAPTPASGICGPPGGSDPCSGELWGPTDPQNYMGYAGQPCWNEFSLQQNGRMQCWIDAVLAGWIPEPPLVTCVDFPSPAAFEAGLSPRSVAAADLDGDGDRDLAVANRGSNDVSILWNLGNGTFAEGPVYAAGVEPEHVAAGDLNGDGYRDLAVANSSDNTVTVLVNAGDGTFVPGGTFGVGEGPMHLVIADLDGDGDPDLAVSNYLGDDLSVLPNLGDGTFGAAIDYAVSDPTFIAAADLNDDGYLDLAVTSLGSEVTVFLGMGGGLFAAGVPYFVDGLVFSLAIDDLDGDGDGDLAVAGAIADSVVLLFNAGDGTFVAGASYEAGAVPVSVDTADIDSDGDPDLIVVNHDDETVMVRFNNGDGTFSGPLSTGSVGSEPYRIAVDDLDGDGDPDIAVTNEDGVSVVWNEGCSPPLCPSYADVTEYELGGSTPTSVAVGDLDADGDPDLAVTAVGSHDVSVLLNAGGGAYADPVRYGAGFFPNFVTMGDLDGDGDQDLVLSNPETLRRVSVLLNNGDGTFASQVLYDTGGAPQSVAVADLDGDGDLDLAVPNGPDDDVSILANAGDGTFGSPVSYGVGNSPESITVGDLNGDGVPDLAVANRGDHDVSVLLNMGDGSFTGFQRYGTGASPRSIAMGDFDGDGDRDLAVACFFGDEVSVLSNLGDGTFASATAYDAGDGSGSVVADDLDGDGDSDLVVAALVGDEVWLLLNADDGSFSSQVVYEAASVVSVATGDLDGDGVRDLVVAGSDLAVLLNECSVVADVPEFVDATKPPRSDISIAPNPFAAVAVLGFELGATGDVDVGVFDVSGRLVRSVHRRTLTAGTHSVSWDGRDDDGRPVPEGVYWVRVSSGRESAHGKVVKLR